MNILYYYIILIVVVYICVSQKGAFLVAAILIGYESTRSQPSTQAVADSYHLPSRNKTRLMKSIVREVSNLWDEMYVKNFGDMENEESEEYIFNSYYDLMNHKYSDMFHESVEKVYDKFDRYTTRYYVRSKFRIEFLRFLENSYNVFETVDELPDAYIEFARAFSDELYTIEEDEFSDESWDAYHDLQAQVYMNAYVRDYDKLNEMTGFIDKFDKVLLYTQPWLLHDSREEIIELLRLELLDYLFYDKRVMYSDVPPPHMAVPEFVGKQAMEQEIRRLPFPGDVTTLIQEHYTSSNPTFSDSDETSVTFKGTRYFVGGQTQEWKNFCSKFRECEEYQKCTNNKCV